MADKKPAEQVKPKHSKLKLAIGAASLLLFIVGVKRSFRAEEAPGPEEATRQEPAAGSRAEAPG